MFWLTRFVILAMLSAIFSMSAMPYSVVIEAERPQLPLRWHTRTITVAISSSFFSFNSNIKYDSDVEGAIDRSFNAWSEASGLTFRLIRTEKLNSSSVGFAGDGVNLVTIASSPENIMMFGRDAESDAAATRILFDSRGWITETDIVLNPLQQFSTDGTFGTLDLESALTHEIGHMLGLDHSPITGATMFGNHGRNGLFGLPRITARSLSDDDISAVRALYGFSSDPICCGRFTGRIVLSNGKAAAMAIIWAEEEESGRVAASIIGDSRGRFELAGVPEGAYRLFAQSKDGDQGILSAAIGRFYVRRGARFEIPDAKMQRSIDPDVKYVGINAQLSNVVIPLLAGSRTTIYFGGESSEFRVYKVGFSSPFIRAASSSNFELEYKNGIAGLGMEIVTDPETPPGDYSVYFENEDGVRIFLAGILTVD